MRRLAILVVLCVVALVSPMNTGEADAWSTCSSAFKYDGHFNQQWGGVTYKLSYAGVGETGCQAQPEISQWPGVATGRWADGWHPVTGYPNYSVVFVHPNQWISHHANYRSN